VRTPGHDESGERVLFQEFMTPVHNGGIEAGSV
jgi:hypothetical protein